MTLLVFIWGLDYVFAKEALKVVQPLNLLFLKYCVGCLVLLAIKLKVDRKTLIRKKDLPWLIMCAVSGDILYNLCEYTAMDYLPVALITIILSFVPAISIMIEKVVYKRKLTLKIVMGVFVCIIGVAIVIGADFRILLQGRIIGYLLAFGAVISWNAYNFITASVSQNYESVTFSFDMLLCTMILLLPYSFHTMPAMEKFTPEVVGSIVYLGIISAGLGFMISVNGLKNLGPTVCAMFSNFLPVTAALFGWMLLGETIGLAQMAGGVIVIASSCMVIAEKGKLQAMDQGRA